MGKIDDLIAVKNAIITNDNLEQKLERCNEIKSRIDLLQEDLDDLYDKLDYFEYPEDSEDLLKEEAIELEENIGRLQKELDKLGGVEFLQFQYKQQDAELDEMLETIGVDSKYDFDHEKKKYLENLVSTEHISKIGEEPDTFFEKLIELYGEKELADFSYTYEKEQEDYDNYQSNIEESHYTYQISDFVSGYEDKIIGLVTDTTLREVLLASKLKFMNTNGIGDVSQYIQEYVEGACKHGHNNIAFLDEYGGVDLETTLANFSKLPISKDKNFYLYLAKHLEEMQLPFESLLEYIDQDMIDEDFLMTYDEVAHSKTYEYIDEFSYTPKKTTDRALIEWLKGKDERLTALEREERTILEAEDLINKQKKARDIGGK